MPPRLGPYAANQETILRWCLRRRPLAITSWAYLHNKSAIADAERLDGVGAGAPDAKLQSLWRKYLQNRTEWNKTEEDTPEYERCHEESTAIATRISATPAQGIVGLAVKIMIAANEPYEHEAVADQTTLDDKALISARDDAMRLTGIGSVPTPFHGTDAPDWPTLLDEYHRLAQASWDASCQEDDANKDDENRPALERAATETRQRCANIERRIAELEVDGLSALAVKMAVAWTDIVPEFEFKPSGLPIKAAVVRSAIDFLSRETGLDLFVEFSREGRGKLPRYDDPEREGGAS